MLVGKKPFFVPEHSADVRSLTGIAIRISRLGKGIRSKFASRYYEDWTDALHMVAYDRLTEARRSGNSWTPAVAFDGNMVLGEWCPMEQCPPPFDQLLIHPDAAIEEVASMMTLRQGDILFIPFRQEPIAVQPEMVIETDLLYCKIK